MIEGVANERRHCGRKGFKFFIVGSVACDDSFGKSAGTHGTPFVMVAAEPNLCDIFVFFVFSDILGIYMAMIVNDGHFRRIMMIEHLCHVVVKQKIFVHKGFHVHVSFLCGLCHKFFK